MNNNIWFPRKPRKMKINNHWIFPFIFSLRPPKGNDKLTLIKSNSWSTITKNKRFKIKIWWTLLYFLGNQTRKTQTYWNKKLRKLWMNEERTLRSALAIWRSWEEDLASSERRAKTEKTRASRNRSGAAMAVWSFFSHHSVFEFWPSYKFGSSSHLGSSPGWPTIIMGSFFGPLPQPTTRPAPSSSYLFLR